MGRSSEVLVSSDLMQDVDSFLEAAKNNPSLPQFKSRNGLLEYAVDHFLEKHSRTKRIPVNKELVNRLEATARKQGLTVYQLVEKWYKEGRLDSQK